MDYGRGRHQSARALPDEGPAFVYTAERGRRSRGFARAIRRSSASRRFSRRCISRSQQGYLTRNAMRHVAEAIGCTPADVEDVVSYYTMFYTRPVGQLRAAGVPDALVRADGRRARDRGTVEGARHRGRARPTRLESSRCSRSSASARAIARRSSASTSTGTSASGLKTFARSSTACARAAPASLTGCHLVNVTEKQSR